MTDTQYQRILSRLSNLENKVNDLVTACSNFITVLQMSEVFSLMQTEVEDLKTVVETLESRVETIEQEPYEDMG